ncbi:MAG TPA: DNA polymerase [candidate division Zixibacteria bacterium]|jgi:DNA polymerase-4
MGRVEEFIEYGDRVRWLFLDLNSYFASVEQELNPALRGKPVAVVPALVGSTCCIAASYEAKACGVKTGTMVAEARRLCPQIRLVEGRPKRYVEYHNAIVEAVERCLPVTAVHSIDEMACRLIGSQREPANALTLARKAKAAIRSDVGSTLACSVGLAPNRYLAKVATDLQKPDGLVLVRSGDLPEILYTLTPPDLPGIGSRMWKRLQARGITTIERLWMMDEKQMKSLWGGIVGQRFWHWLHGHDIPDIVTKHSSLGHSHVLPPKLRTEAGTYQVLQKLLHKAAARLRWEQMWTTRMMVYVKFYNKESWEAKASFIECQDTLTFLETLRKLWDERPSFAHRTPLAAGITFIGLIPDERHNMSLFGGEKRVALSAAIDRITAKYGKRSVYFGGIHGLDGVAPTRIGFTSIPNDGGWW